MGVILSRLLKSARLLFYYRRVPSLEPFLQVFGRGLRGNGSHNWVQQGAAEQSKQPAQAAGPAGDWRPSAADTIEREKQREKEKKEVEIWEI